jgi:hypothetical protein
MMQPKTEIIHGHHPTVEKGISYVMDNKEKDTPNKFWLNLPLEPFLQGRPTMHGGFGSKTN